MTENDGLSPANRRAIDRWQNGKLQARAQIADLKKDNGRAKNKDDGDKHCRRTEELNINPFAWGELSSEQNPTQL